MLAMIVNATILRLLRTQEHSLPQYDAGLIASMADPLADRSPRCAAWRALISVTTGVLATLDNELRADARAVARGVRGARAPLGGAGPLAAHDRPRGPACTCRRAASPAGSTAWCRGAGRTPAVPVRPARLERGAHRGGMKPAPGRGAHARRGVRRHFIDQLSERQLANLAAALVERRRSTPSRGRAAATSLPESAAGAHSPPARRARRTRAIRDGGAIRRLRCRRCVSTRARRPHAAGPRNEPPMIEQR